MEQFSCVFWGGGIKGAFIPCRSSPSLWAVLTSAFGCWILGLVPDLAHSSFPAGRHWAPGAWQDTLLEISADILADERWPLASLNDIPKPLEDKTAWCKCNWFKFAFKWGNGTHRCIIQWLSDLIDWTTAELSTRSDSSPTWSSSLCDCPTRQDLTTKHAGPSRSSMSDQAATEAAGQGQLTAEEPWMWEKIEKERKTLAKKKGWGDSGTKRWGRSLRWDQTARRGRFSNTSPNQSLVFHHCLWMQVLGAAHKEDLKGHLAATTRDHVNRFSSFLQ